MVTYEQIKKVMLCPLCESDNTGLREEFIFCNSCECYIGKGETCQNFFESQTIREGLRQYEAYAYPLTTPHWMSVFWVLWIFTAGFLASTLI